MQTGATIAGYGTIAAPVEDSGSIIAQAGTLDLAQAVSGSGTIEIDAGATVSAAGALTGVKMMFATGGDDLSIADPSDVTGALHNFASGDTIDLVNLAATSLSFFGSKLTIKNGKVVIGTLTFQGSYNTADFSLQSDGHGGTEINFVAAARDSLGWVRNDLPFSSFLMPLSADLIRAEQSKAEWFDALPRSVTLLTGHDPASVFLSGPLIRYA